MMRRTETLLLGCAKPTAKKWEKKRQPANNGANNRSELKSITCRRRQLRFCQLQRRHCRHRCVHFFVSPSSCPERNGDSRWNFGTWSVSMTTGGANNKSAPPDDDHDDCSCSHYYDQSLQFGDGKGKGKARVKLPESGDSLSFVFLVGDKSVRYYYFYWLDCSFYQLNWRSWEEMKFKLSQRQGLATTERAPGDSIWSAGSISNDVAPLLLLHLGENERASESSVTPLHSTSSFSQLFDSLIFLSSHEMHRFNLLVLRVSPCTWAKVAIDGHGGAAATCRCHLQIQIQTRKHRQQVAAAVAVAYLICKLVAQLVLILNIPSFALNRTELNWTELTIE